MKKNKLTKKEKLLKRIDYAIEEGLTSWSGTIAPAEKDMSKNCIESVEQAIRYYYNNGVTSLVLQPKYMGSYCAIYLYPDIQQTKFFSRNGYPINYIDKNVLLDAVTDLHSTFYPPSTKESFLYKEVIIEAELMPWSVLGKHLIDLEYVNYYTSNKLFIENIKEILTKDIPEFIDDNKETITSFEQFENMVGVKSASNNFPHHVSSMLKAIKNIKDSKLLSSVETIEQALEIIQRQLELFAYPNSETTYFEPFNVLRLQLQDGTYEYPSNVSFALVNNKKDLKLLHITQDDEASLSQAIQEAIEYANKYEKLEFEGIVVKPTILKPNNEGKIMYPQALKVRNNAYLHLIYGISYAINFEELLVKRDTKSRLYHSIKDTNLKYQLIRATKTEQEKRMLFSKLLSVEEKVLVSTDSTL